MLTPLALVLAAAGAVAASGVAALVLARAPRLATAVAVAGAIVGGAVGLVAAALALAPAATSEIGIAWGVPGGRLVIGIDPLSAFFLAPLFGLGAVCAGYGRGYLGPRPAAAAALNLLVAAMALVLVARNGMVFLVAWETMTLLAYLLVTLEHGDATVRRAGWSYLIASHVAVMALIAFFLLLGARAGGSLDFDALAGGGAGLVVLALVGFGIKAGVIGLHVWLPEAHAAAPSHVSALMSGVLIKLGVYGILRAALLVAPGAWFGATLMVLGGFGAVLGIALALYQRDLKRVLAYSSVENIGVILLALGLGLWARSHGDRALAALALAGGLLHVWNHAAMKALMFLGAGNVVHGAGGKDIEALGGLLRPMPWTGRALILGAVAIAALPPLNGFVGEWLVYRALAEVGLHGVAAASLLAMAGAAALALVGGLAALCFVRLVGVVVLGAPRSAAAAHAHEVGPALIAPLAVLASACVVFAFAAPILVGVLAPVVAELGGADVGVAAGLLHPLVAVNAVLLAVLLAASAVLARRARRAARAGTWDCGYAAPAARMQYTGSGFAEFLAARVLPRWLRPRTLARAPEGLFPGAASFTSDTSDPITRGVYEPFLVGWGDRFARLRFLQQGNVHMYILYIVVTTILALAWFGVSDARAP